MFTRDKNRPKDPAQARWGAKVRWLLAAAEKSEMSIAKAVSMSRSGLKYVLDGVRGMKHDRVQRVRKINDEVDAAIGAYGVAPYLTVVAAREGIIPLDRLADEQLIIVATTALLGGLDRGSARRFLEIVARKPALWQTLSLDPLVTDLHAALGKWIVAKLKGRSTTVRLRRICQTYGISLKHVMGRSDDGEAAISYCDEVRLALVAAHPEDPPHKRMKVEDRVLRALARYVVTVGCAPGRTWKGK